MDTAVARIHNNMMRAMGGARAWEKARYFEFDFVPVRKGTEAARWSHRWDRWRGDYRLSGVRGSDTIAAWFNINDPKAGRILVNGADVSAESRDSLLNFAYARHINDSYWLIMPYKWLGHLADGKVAPLSAGGRPAIDLRLERLATVRPDHARDREACAGWKLDDPVRQSARTDVRSRESFRGLSVSDQSARGLWPQAPFLG